MAGRNDIYSEICQVNDSRSELGRYVRRQICYKVELEVEIVGDKVLTTRGYQISWGFYVHPETGILHQATKRAKYRGCWPKQDDLYQIEGDHYCEKMNGIWYDVGIRRRVENPFWTYQRDRYSWTYEYKRQLSGKELRRYGLQND
jgi:hypothetical protein